MGPRQRKEYENVGKFAESSEKSSLAVLLKIYKLIINNKVMLVYYYCAGVPRGINLLRNMY